MQISKFFSLAILVATGSVFVSCDKDNFSDFETTDTTFVVDDNNNDTDGDGDVDGEDQPTEQAAKAMFINSDLTGMLDDLIIQVNGVTIIGQLAINQVTNYIDIPGNGDIVVNLINSTGDIVFSTTRDLLNNTYYNVILLVDNLGNPSMEFIELDQLDFITDNELFKQLGFGDQQLPAFLFNVLNLSDFGGDFPLLGLDFLDADRNVVSGLLELPQGILSGVVAGNPLMLSDVNLIESGLPLEDLIKGLIDENAITGFTSFGDIFGLDGIKGIVSGLVDVIGDLLGGIFGGGSPLDDLTVIDAFDDIFSKETFEIGHKYTVVLLGQDDDIVTMIIDHTKAGLEF